MPRGIAKRTYFVNNCNINNNLDIEFPEWKNANNKFKKSIILSGPFLFNYMHYAFCDCYFMKILIINLFTIDEFPRKLVREARNTDNSL